MTTSPARVRPHGLLALASGVAAALGLAFTITLPTTGAAQPSPPATTAPDGGQGAAAAPPSTPSVPVPEDAPTNPPPPVGDGRTVVSLTFDDGTADQLVGARALDAAGLPATFYVVSSWIGRPGYLSQPDLVDLRMSGHEIGGHTTTHHDLAQLPEVEIRRQVCDNRADLQDWGFEPVSFAYPFTSTTPTAEDVVRGCGYDTGRALGDLRTHDDCTDCPTAGAFLPEDPFRLDAPAQVDASWTLRDLQDRVRDARAGGGGWVPLTFHDVCSSPGAAGCPASKSIDPDLFREFVQWLDRYEQVWANRTSVATVGDTYRASLGDDHPGYRAAHAEPDAPVAPPGSNAVANPSLENVATGSDDPRCFESGGWGTNRASWSSAPGRTGGTARQVTVTGHSSGDAKLMPTMDLGKCSPSVTPGQRYDLGTWHTSTGVTQFAVHYRTPQGRWKYWTSSPWLDPQKEWTQATWTTPPVPEDATAISFGLALIDNGTLVTDDYSMVDPGTS